jgi:pyruvate dehydrogenase E2 component (dihydrolipoamide acetyltransferase)
VSGPIEFRLADVGEGIDAAELLAWHVAVGDRVREDDPLADVQTDKAIVTIPCPADGVIAELRFAPGDSVAVGATLAVIEPEAAGAAAAPREAAPAAAAPAAREAAPAAAAPAPAPAAAAPREPAVARPVLASPATRRLARRRGIDLATLAGSGPNGRIRREDVEQAAPAAPEPLAARTAQVDQRPGTVVPLGGIRRVIAQRMTEAWRTVPHIIDHREADVTRLLELRDALRARARAREDEALARAMTLTPLMVKIACRALAEHPYVNSSLDMEREEITHHAHCHIGIATSTPHGLVVPVLRDAEALSLVEIARAVVDLSAAARDRKLTPDALRGGTFTVNNFGALGIWLGTPLIVPPQVANLGIGRIAERAVVRDGAIVAAPIVALSVSGDHRVLDGDTLAAFVTRVVELIEQPALLVEDVP